MAGAAPILAGIGKAASAIGAVLTAKTAIGMVARFAVGVAVSALLSRRQPSFDQSLRARALTSRGSLDPQKLVYGEAVVSGSMVIPPQPAGTNNLELWNVIALAGHECSNIYHVWLDDRFIHTSNINSGNAAGGVVDGDIFDRKNGKDVVRINKHLGTATQTVDPQLSSAMGAAWGANHRGRGICHIVTMFNLFDETEELWDQVPRNIKALVRGKIVYDPRLDTSPGANPDNALYFAWTDNPALCAADYVRDSKFGPEHTVTASRIDWDSVDAAADWCDVLVSIPGPSTQKRATCNIVLLGSADPEQNLLAILETFNGSFEPYGDKWVMSAGYTAPAVTIDETQILDSVGLSSTIEPAQRVNTIKALFVDPAHDYQPKQAPAKTSATLLARDKNIEYVDTIELLGVNNWYQAQRVAIWELAKRNQGKPTKVVLPIKYAAYRPGERVNLTFSRRGWASKIFRIVKFTFVFSVDAVMVEYELREDDSGAWADPAVGDYDTETTAGALVAADVVLIPSVDTIPGGIDNYGVGTWNIQLTKNLLSNDTANDGEIQFTAGKFLLPTGGVRTLTKCHVLTPYEGAVRPPDRRGFVIWGATALGTRFPSGTWGDATAIAAGLFPAVYDRIAGEWWAVDDTNARFAFTPAATDYLVARFIKSSASGGLDSVTAIPPFLNEPESTRNTGALADQDTVGVGDIDNDAVDTGQIADDAVGTGQIADDAVDTGQIADGAVGAGQIANGAVVRVSQAEAAGPVSISGSTWVEVETVAITLPASVANARVLIDFHADSEYNALFGVGGVPPESSNEPFELRLLDQDNVEVDKMQYYVQLVIQDSSLTPLSRVWGGARQVTYSFTVQPANLNASASNTFKIQMREHTSATGINSAFATDIRLRATFVDSVL